MNGHKSLGLVGVLGAEWGALVLLRQAGEAAGVSVRWSDLGGWLAETRTEDALVALARTLALGLAWWLLASTLLCLAANLVGLPSLLRKIAWLTVPGVRRLVDGLVAGSVVAGTSLGTAAPAVAEFPPAAPEHVYVPRPAGDGSAYVPTPAGDIAPKTPASVPAPPATEKPPVVAAPAAPAAPDAPRTSHRVEPGEHLWGIAHAHLAAASGRPAADLRAADLRAADIAPYWRRLIDANANGLRSGDPDLIHPGEELVLPEIDERR